MEPVHDPYAKQSKDQLRTMNVKVIPLIDIDDDPKHNCRGTIMPIEAEPLADDIKKKGLLQPIVVREIKIPGMKPYRCVAGFTRIMAFRILAMKEIPCVVKDVNDGQSAILNLTENIGRRQLNILQEANAIKKIRETNPHVSQEDIAEICGMSRGWAQMRVYLLDLPEEIQRDCGNGKIRGEYIRELWMIPLKADQLAMAKKIKEARERGERLVVRPRDIKLTLDEKKVRTRGHVFQMQKHIQDNFGNCFGTRCLAWAAGEITDRELFFDLKALMDADEKPYSVPMGTLPPLVR